MKHTVNAGVHRADSGRRPVSGTMSFKRADARAFDTSSTMRVCSAFCRGLLRLRLRVIGVALLTFGVYSAVVAVISGAVSGELSFSNVYFGVGAALLSVPLLLSGGNVSSALLGSGTGKVIRRFLCLRSESVTDYTMRGRFNVAFIVGAFLGTATIFVSPLRVASTVLATLLTGVLLCSPENGIVLFACLLPFGSRQALASVICVSAVSFFVKFIRGKRRISLTRSDALAAVAAFSILCSGISATGFSKKTLWSAGLAAVYFLCVMLMRECRRINLAAAALTVSGGAAATVYVVGRLLETLLSPLSPVSNFAGAAAYAPGYVSTLAESIPMLSGGSPFVLAALCILAAGQLMRSDSAAAVPRSTVAFCLMTMLTALIFMGEKYALLSVAASAAILLLIINRRIAYAAICIACAAGTLLLYVGDTGTRVHRLVSALASEGAALAARAGLTVGYLTGGIAAGSAALDGRSDMLYALSVLGVAGALSFGAFSLSLILKNAGFYKSTSRAKLGVTKIERFNALKSVTDMNAGAAALMCAAIALLMCSLFSAQRFPPTALSTVWLFCGLNAAYLRSGSSEIGKAGAADSYFYDESFAEATVNFSPQS